MKKVSVLTFLISSAAFAHEVKFDQPDLLDMAGGDPVAAQELSIYCDMTGKNLTDCKDSLEGGGNLRQEAVRRCINKQNSVSFNYKFDNGTEIPGSRANKVHGSRWHVEYREDEEGMHRHEWSEDDKKRAVAQYKKQLIDEAIATKLGLYGSASKTAGQGVTGGASVGISGFFTVNVGANGSDSTTKALSVLSPKEMENIEKESQKAKDNPQLGKTDPSITCELHEKDCIGANGEKKPNVSYEPEKKEEPKKEEPKKEEPKKSDPPPKAEEVHKEVHTVHVDTHGASWAGNDTKSGGTMIATPLDDEYMPKSALEHCVETEFKGLADNVGSITVNPNVIELDLKGKADTLLLTGYCDESFFGIDFCRDYKNKLNTVPTVELNEIKKQKAENALKEFKLYGVCDKFELGADFCKKEKFKLESVPFDHGDFRGKTDSNSKYKFDMTKFDRGGFGEIKPIKGEIPETSRLPKLNIED